MYFSFYLKIYGRKRKAQIVQDKWMIHFYYYIEPYIPNV